jgi:hypothetical protein
LLRELLSSALRQGWHSPVAFLALCGCAASQDDPELLGISQPVISGQPSPATDDGVVLLRADRASGTSVCSGSLLAPNLVMTARHCIVAEYPEDNIRCKPDGSLDLPSGGQLGDPIEAGKVNVYVGADVATADGSFPGGEPAARGTSLLTTTWPSVCRDDIAFLILDRVLTQPVLSLDLQDAVAVADQLTVVGYGLTEDSSELSKYSTRQRREGVRVKYIDTLPNSFVVSRSVCKGDSGGPALHAETGAVLGVFSLGFPGDDVASCSSDTALNYFVQVNRYEELMRQAFTAAGAPFPDPIASGGASGESASGDGSGGDALASGTGGVGGEAATGGGSATPRPATGDGCQMGSPGSRSRSGALFVTTALLVTAGLRRRRSPA